MSYFAVIMTAIQRSGENMPHGDDSLEVGRVSLNQTQLWNSADTSATRKDDTRDVRHSVFEGMAS